MRPLHARSQGSTNIRSCWFSSALGLNAGTVVKKERANPRTAKACGIRAQRHIDHFYRRAKASLEAFPSEEASPKGRVRRRAQDALLRNEEWDRSPEGPYSLCIVQGPTCWYGRPVGFLRSSGDVDRHVSRGRCPYLRAHEKVWPSPVSVPAATQQALLFYFLYSLRDNPDLNAAARLVFSDWSISKLSRYAILPVFGPRARH